MKTVAFFGLGLMGRGMALRLLEEDIGLHVYNSTADKATPVVEKGAELFGDPVAAVQSVTVLISILSDDDAVAELVDKEVLQALGSDDIHLSMSTISPAAAKMLAE